MRLFDHNAVLFPFILYSGISMGQRGDIVHYDPFDASTLEYQFQTLESQYNVTPMDLSGIYPVDGECAPFYEKHFPWSRSLGDGKFGTGINFDAYLQGSCEGYRSGADARVRAALFSRDFSLAQANAVAGIGKSEMFFDTGVYVLGYEVARKRYSENAVLRISGSPRQNIQVSQEVPLQIGPVPVTVEFGLAGHVIFDWMASISIVELIADMIPHISVDSFIIGSIAAAKVVSLGVKGSVNVIDESLAIKSSLNVINLEGRAGLKGRVIIDNFMKSLSGFFSGVVKLFSKEIYYKEFFRWNGFSKTDNLLDYVDYIRIPDDN
ncbi:MAG: hypothetical protein HQK54_03675 [Oligoflexales bacterium]|nr:hypothetical protein [Oligoflexales bacterium]